MQQSPVERAYKSLISMGCAEAVVSNPRVRALSFTKESR